MRTRASTLVCTYIFLMSVLFSAAFGTDFTQWRYSKRLYINTKSMGLSEDVQNFPLLVRLSENTFNFNTAKDDGTDIRFSLPDSTSLDFEIAVWDKSCQNAEIWVEVPTIYKENSDQYIMFYWGNAAATDISSGKNVFERTNNYTAVYHLSDINHIDDATEVPPNEYDGTNYYTVGTQGVLGKAVNFEGPDYINLPTGAVSPITSQITIEFWQYGSTYYLPQSNRLLWGLDYYGNRALNMSMWYDEEIAWDCGNQVINGCNYYDRIKRYPASSSEYKGQWNHWVFIKNCSTGEMRMYLNGEEYAGVDSGKTYPINIHYIRIGADNYGQYNYDGKIDELRFSKVVRSPSWIKLCYETQKEIQNVVDYKDFLPLSGGTMQGDIAMDKNAITTHGTSDSSHQNTGKVNYAGIELYGLPTTQDASLDTMALNRDKYKYTRRIGDESYYTRFDYGEDGRKPSLTVGKEMANDSSATRATTITPVAVTTDSVSAVVINAGSFKVNDWEIGTIPDYVFKSDYKLRTLETVEQFLKENSHLPEIPSAQQIKDKGIDLVRMNMLLLQKIEELTLYSIEQNKRLKMQQRELGSLKKMMESVKR